MVKSKYKWNPETLHFEKVVVSIWTKLWKLFRQMAASIVFGVIFYIVFTYFVSSPQERYLKRENAQLKLQFEIFNKKLENIKEVLGDIQYRDDNIYRVIFNSAPIPNAIRQAGIGGVNRYEELEGYSNSELIIATAKQLDKVAKQLYVQSKSFDEVVYMARNKETMLKCIPAIQPVKNPDLTKLVSGFGYRTDPVYRNITEFHSGVDFAFPVGTPIYATGDGKVIAAEWSTGGYGKMIIIDHGFGFKTLYAHMHEFKVRPGQQVKRGEIIGYVGNTGKSVGPHLHYEVIKNNEKINPIHYFYNDLSPIQYEQIISIANQNTMPLD